MDTLRRFSSLLACIAVCAVLITNSNRGNGQSAGRASAERPKLLPTPQNMVVEGGTLTLTAKSAIITRNEGLRRLANVLADEIASIYGLRLLISNRKPSPGDIVLDTDANISQSPKLDTTKIDIRAGKGSQEAYLLEVDGKTAHVTGHTYNAVASGTVTLLQSMSLSGGRLTLPRMRIQDGPSFAYRGALLDLARKYHTPGGIEQVIELCRLYKIRYLQLHLTDDQLFMFPSQLFPHVGKTNREFARFEPASRPKILPYTREEIQRLERFASERAVCLVPEIDLPGHSGRLIADANEIFGIPGNGSTVNIASERTRKALTTLINEMIDLFPSTPYIHLGADEVGLGGLEQTADYKRLQAEEGIKSVHDLYCKFVAEMVATVEKRGKRAIVWEEACNAEGTFPLPKSALVMVWSQGRNPNDLVKQGYEVVNATWTPLYIVRDNKRSMEFLSRWSPALFGREGSDSYTSLNETERLLGAQLCSWEDSEAIEIQSMRDRLALVAERLWNPQATGDLAQFRSRFAHTDGILERLVHPVRIQAEGTFKGDENTFITPLKITLKPARPGLSIRYTLDNSLPDVATNGTAKGWQLYTGPILLTKTAHLRAGLFDAQGKQQGYLAGSWYRSAIPARPNLATNRPVTVGPSPDRTDAWAAKVAVDGQFDDAGKHWASEGAAPQWLQVDLGKETAINFINVITYWDGGRYYQWNAEVSVDGKKWNQVLDFSKNTAPATSEGYSGRFTTTNARYVRINMLKNSANPYVHIVELIVDHLR